MWGKLLELGEQIFTLKQQIENSVSEINELRKDLKEISTIVREMIIPELRLIKQKHKYKHSEIQKAQDNNKLDIDQKIQALEQKNIYRIQELKKKHESEIEQLNLRIEHLEREYRSYLEATKLIMQGKIWSSTDENNKQGMIPHQLEPKKNEDDLSSI